MGPAAGLVVCVLAMGRVDEAARLGSGVGSGQGDGVGVGVG